MFELRHEPSLLFRLGLVFLGQPRKNGQLF